MLNNRCLVDKWGLGLEFERDHDDENNIIVRRDEVARKVRALMRRNADGDTPAPHRERATRWQDVAQEAVQTPNGSSSLAFAQVVKSMLG